MREIKFRAWDKATRKILEVIEIDFQGMEILVIDHEEQEAREAVHGHYELMQYTGLKDKNGTEIYEGDIVEYHDTSIKSDVISPVSWSAPMFVVDSGLLYFISKEDNKVFDGRIIGNIYENPELLGDSQ